ncbi:MAG: rhamnogalacturonan acetylesterase [Paludibacteraceae bacterium]|nr:rhamnogalacturonan acetylesterase [Paludibacteraceae bacterium]
MRKIFSLAMLSAMLLLPSLQGGDGGRLFAAKRRVHTIGDSTMSDYKPAATPKRGWGMYLQAFFNADSVSVNNRGKSGASTRTFYETDNLWPSVKKQMKAGDYLIIQFAHNDEKCKGEDVYVENARLRAEGKDTLTDMRGTEPNTTYKEYLFRFINEAREMGVTPILMSPICRAYFKDGKINDEGRHKLAGTKELTRTEAAKVLAPAGTRDKDYVRCMQEVAQEMAVPFLDMTARSREFYEQAGQNYCMANYFNCGDKTHTSAAGGMAIASLAYELITNSPELEELKSWMVFPSKEAYNAYAQNIEEAGKKAALDAKGTPFSEQLAVTNLQHIERTKKGYIAAGGLWPAGEIDEVANRYIEYTIAAEKKKGLVIETITLPLKAIGGPGMNIHINYGFGEEFSGVTTIYENTALPKNKKITIQLDQPILVPAGQTLHLRILPWYDSNGKPQGKKYLQLGDLNVTGKRLQ